MSYIIQNSSPFISVKLTEIARKKLATASLSFTYVGFGDSEIDYSREQVVNDNPTNISLSGVSRILRPVDKNPNIKSFVSTGITEPLVALNNSNIKLVKTIVNNLAEERGTFSSNTITFITQTGSTYIQSTGLISNSTITGGTTVLLSSGFTRQIGDIVLFKFTNNIVTGQTNNSNTLPIPNLWYRIISTNNTSITVDRNLPNLASQTGSSSQFIIYLNDPISSATTSNYWDSNTLNFSNFCNISCSDVPFWNQSSVWCENLAGITGSTAQTFEWFGSYAFLGTKNPYFEIPCAGTATTNSTICSNPGSSVIDDVKKSISIFHYTNNTISNFYGEFFYIDTANDKTLKLYLPDLMHHNRNFSSGSGTTMGMTFIASGSTQDIGNSDIEYYDLIEDPTMVDGIPQKVGKVFPQLKMVIIDDDEITAAISYKSNRNWTLPPLSATLSSPTGSTSVGLLGTDKTMYLTYILENNTGTGLTSSLNCQIYTKITNNTSSIKDISFKISDIDLLPYMRKKELAEYDGFGFYAYNFKVLYQIVDDVNDRPDTAAWKVYDFTTTAITTVINQTIDPKLLENQNPVTNGFVLNSIINSGATTFSLIEILNMPAKTDTNSLQFGMEKFFNGNLSTYIGATIFKTIFDLRVNSSQYNFTSNPTRSTDESTNPPDIVITEVGIYDSDKDLVVIGKYSKPVKLVAGQTVMLELSLDF